MKTRSYRQGTRLAWYARWSAALLLSVGCLLSVSACSSGDATNAGGHGSISESVRQESPLLLPPTQGSLVGWCLTIKPGECEAARAFQGPIVAESDRAQGSPLTQTVTVLTTSAVAAVSVDGGPNNPTQSDPRLPDGLRSAVVEVRGGPGVNVSGFGKAPRPLSLKPLNAKGEFIQRPVEPRGSLFFVVPSRRWTSPAKVPRGPCEIHASSLTGLVVGGGVVVDRLVSHAELPANPLLACVSTSFRLKGAPLIATLLVDATHPGTTPTALPAMKVLPGHPGIYEAIGGGIGGLADGGQILARRVPGAWLVVGRAESIQRLALLENLTAAVHL